MSNRMHALAASRLETREPAHPYLLDDRPPDDTGRSGVGRGTPFRHARRSFDVWRHWPAALGSGPRHRFEDRKCPAARGRVASRARESRSTFCTVNVRRRALSSELGKPWLARDATAPYE